MFTTISDVTSQNYEHVFYANACRNKNTHENWNSVNNEINVDKKILS
jgi:hypothetical protein